MPSSTAQMPNIDDAARAASIPTEFPIATQTSAADKLTLLKVRDYMSARGPYDYVEIGSYLGGSLVPFVKDPSCTSILSIDHRGRNQPDERGSLHDYTAITHQTMLDNLARCGLATDKIETFDGSVSDYAKTGKSYDLLFIDGEHTDWACFRDFIHGMKLVKPNSIIMFHDTCLIYKSIQIITEYLVATSRTHRFFKPKVAEVSFILLDDYCQSGFAELFDIETDYDTYTAKAARMLLKSNIRHRTRVPGFLIDSLVPRTTR